MVVSLYVAADMRWSGVCDGHVTDVTQTGNCRWKVEVYVPQGPPQEAPLVFGYIEVSCKRHTPNIHKCIHRT